MDRVNILNKGLLTILDNDEEPICKRIKIADNTLKSLELALPHKKAVLLRWIVKTADYNNKEPWELLNNWMNSDQFKDLKSNDIDNEEITSIITVIQKRLLEKSDDNFSVRTIFNSLLALLQNEIFQQYFRCNITIYCELISGILDKIQCPIYFKEFLKKDLFSKSIKTEEKFHKHFLEIIVPTLANNLIKFNNDGVFQEVSKIIQKCIFYTNHKNFAIFINQCFEDGKIEKQLVPNTLFKYLLDYYKVDKQKARIKYKLILHAFCTAYDADFELSYKFFILLVHIIGFNLKNELIFHKFSKLEIPAVEISLDKSQEIFLELIDVLSENKNNLNCKIKDISFTNFIRNILRQLLYFNAPSNTCYKVFIKAIAIDPLVIEPIIDYIIIYTMMADNREQTEEYENIILSIFEVYSKMHRIESLIAKIVSTLNHGFNGTVDELKEIYGFNGERDIIIRVKEKKDYKVQEILTENILRNFSKCICSLASWQVINVFKTLLYHLKGVLSYIHKVKNDNTMYFVYMEILSTLIGTFLSSIRIAEQTVAENVVDKSVRELEELRTLLKQFGLALINKEHIHMLMRSFLNIAYNWAEIYMMLEYYSIDKMIEIKKSRDSDFTSCNITYLHSYLNIQQWCLISERITNFGEPPCKELLQKLYIQKLRAMVLFEKNVSPDVVSNILRSITANLELTWRDVLQDKYVVNHLLQKMDSDSIIFLADKLVNNIEEFVNFHKQPHILNSLLLLTSINYTTITKINKLLVKQKRNRNENLSNGAVSTNIYFLLKENKFFNEENQKEVVEKAKSIYRLENQRDIEWKISEEKMIHLLNILQKFPVIYCSESVQKMYLLYLCSLHRDFSYEFKNGNYKKFQNTCEILIVGVLKHYKFKLVDLFDLQVFCKEIVKSYEEWEQITSVIIENVFKCAYSIKEFEPLVSYLTENLTPVHMRCCIIIINAVNKLKKSKIYKDVKSIAETYKTVVCDKILELVSKKDPQDYLISGFVWALRSFLTQNDDEKLSKLLNSLNSYVDFSLNNTTKSDPSNLLLVITVLQNKSKLKSLSVDFPRRVWNAYKENEGVYSNFEEYSQLIVLVFGFIPNEEFTTVTTEFLNITEKSIDVGDFVSFGKHLKTWESVFSCNVNTVKMKILNNVLDKLLQKLISLLENSTYNKELYENIFKFENTIVQAGHLLLNPAMLDMLILSVDLVMLKEDDFKNIFDMSMSLLECLLRYRKPLIMDILPQYVEEIRIIVKSLCGRSNSDLNLEDTEIMQVSDCAHRLEKFVKNLTLCQRDMARIGVHLLANILQQYEQITLYPNVKIHLNNCVYSLISIFDQHAVATSMRVLSSASTEIFKIMYENYKKYYRFTGKV